MRYETRLLRRFFSKLFDILPAALASAVGGFLFTHYELGRAPEPAAQVAPASAEMMQLLRDEHGLIVNFLNARIANEKPQIAAADGAPRVAADVEPATAMASPRQALAMAATKPAAALRNKTPVVGASLPPLVIAQARQDESVKPDVGGSDSLLAKTIGIKDHVIAVTHHVVSVIGGIPSWIGWIGEHAGGDNTTSSPPGRLASVS